MTEHPTATTNGHARRDPPGERRDPAARAARRRRIRRIVLWVLGVLVVLLGLATVFAAIQTIGIRERLTEGRDALDRAQDAVTDGDLGVAGRSFAEAQNAFADAKRAASGPAYTIVGAVPLIGRTPRAVEGITTAGEELAAAGTVLTDGIASLPDGLGSLSPENGRVPLAPIATLSAAAEQAEVHTNAAVEAIEGAPSTLLVGPLGEARRDAAEGVDRADDAVHAGRLLLEGLPTFLGGDGTARYFVAAESPAELRGTGGILGAYSIMTVADGRFRFGEFLPVQTLSDPAAWQNVNLSPDFAGDVGPRIVEQYEAETGQRLDGAIEVDPFALAKLLEVTGPVELRDLGVELTAEDVVAFTANEAYSEYPDPATRKAVLGEAAQEVFLRFLAGGEGIDGIRALGEAAAGGHLTVYSTDPTMQEGLQAVGAAGDLRVTEGEDFLAVVMNNGAGNKVDYYQSRTVNYTVDLLSDGTGRGSTEITIANGAPASGLPKYVIGPFDGRFEAGETFALVDVLCAPGCALDRLQRGGADVEPAATGDFGGIPYVRDVFSIPAGEQQTLGVDTRLASAWTGNSSGGTYRLVFANQTTVEPTRLRVEIRPPDGMAFTHAGDGVELGDGIAVWEGEPGARVEVDVDFSAPVPGRWWRNLTRWVS
ncbi:MAG: DUF4012 domain-containing protein [Actinomycetota bacterium]